MIVSSNRLKAQVLSFAREKDLRSLDLLTADMAQNSSNFSTWSSSSDANLCYKFDDCTDMRDSALEEDMDQSAWLEIERVTAQHCPTQIQFQRPDVLGSVERQYDSGFNERINNLTNKNPVDSSVICRIPNRTRSHAEESFQKGGENQVMEAPPRKIKTGRRRRVSDGSPDGWVASKNLISERKRREKLQKGLITLRELVPMFTMKVSSVPPHVWDEQVVLFANHVPRLTFWAVNSFSILDYVASSTA